MKTFFFVFFPSLNAGTLILQHHHNTVWYSAIAEYAVSSAVLNGSVPFSDFLCEPLPLKTEILLAVYCIFEIQYNSVFSDIFIGNVCQRFTKLLQVQNVVLRCVVLKSLCSLKPLTVLLSFSQGKGL